MSNRAGGVPKEVLDDVVRRIVEVAAPEKIILFGSAARGELGPNSDIDLLVIKGGRV
jgi:predicted nucleotidyltransferase